MKKKILILNGSHSEVPLIISAKKLGLKVLTTGGLPSGIGHKYSDRYIKADFSDKDLILNIAKKNKINFICPPAHDLGMLTASYVAEKLKLPGFDSLRTTEIIHHKDKFKKFCKKINFKTPATFNQNLSFNEIKNIHKISKVIIKPVDLGGGKGITIAKDNKSYEKGIEVAKKVSKSKKIVVEEFVEGQLHSLTSFIKNQKVTFYHHDNEFSFRNPYNVHTSFSPSTIPQEKLDEILLQLNLFAQNLKITNGILHAQIIVNKIDYFIIELTRRCSGDLYPLPVQFVNNVPWSDIIIKSCMAKKINVLGSQQLDKFCARHCLTANKNGLAEKIFIHPSIKKNIIAKIIILKNKEIIDDYENKKYGVFILKFSTFQEMKNKVNIINQLIYIKTN